MAAKSMVDKYEQILGQDPTSTVFVELAKALIEKGDHSRAIDVCRNGLSHHKGSVVGRVLWGKALIHMGRPAEAMEQFDEAIAIDRDNPHAYNLIGEVLLHKGLYRSALPLLRKAAALQPNDGRIKQWLEQTQRALAGGPAPILSEAEATQVTDPASPVTAAPDLASEPTQVLRAFVPTNGHAKEAPSAGAARTTEGTHPRFAAVAIAPERVDAGGTMEDVAIAPTMTGKLMIPVLARADEQLPVPSDALPLAPATPEKEVAKVAGASKEPVQDPFQEFPSPPAADTVRGLTSTFDALTSSIDPNEPVAPAPTVVPEAQAASTIVPAQELFDDGPIEQTEISLNPGRMAKEARPPPVPARTSAEHRALLEEIPELKDGNAPLVLPRVNFTPQATEALAKEYERELREKLEEQKEVAKKSFLARHWVKMAAATVVLIAMVAGAIVFLATRAKNQGRDFKDALAVAKKGVAEDTVASYRAALESSRLALSMDEKSADAWALTGLAHAILYAEHGARAEDKAKALEALERPAVKASFPDTVLLARYHLADSKGKEELRKDILSGREDSQVEEMAGRILLSQKNPDGALKRFRRALDLNPRNVRALVAVGNYYREAGDYTSALSFYAGDAAKLSPKHPERALGAAEARLVLEQDEAESLKDVEGLTSKDEVLPPDLLTRKELLHGRLLSATGHHPEAVQRLSDGLKAFPARAYEFQLALGQALYRAGRMSAAETAFQAALALKATEDAKQGLGRALLASDRPDELLRKLPAEDSRKVSLVRGAAFVQLKDFKRARAELAKTQVAGKFPTEAVIQLALADAGDDKAERAQEVLEKALAATKRAKGTVRVALGNVYWVRNALDKARVQYEAATNESDDWEAPCALGRLLLVMRQPDKAVDALTRAVSRNEGHDEANHALIRALYSLGKYPEAMKHAEAWKAAKPVASPQSMADLALTLLANVRAKDAEGPSARAAKAMPKDAEVQRIRARVLYARGDGRGAFSALEAAQKAAPKDGETGCEMALAFYRHGKTDSALKQAQEASKADLRPVCSFAVHALIRPDKGQLKVLQEVANQAASLPEKGLLKTGLSRAFLATGDLGRARKEADAAVTLVPYSGFAQFVLGQVLLKERDEPKAREAFTTAVSLEPALGPARLALAEVLLKGDDADLPKAVEQYDAFLKIGGSPFDEARVKRALAGLKKKLAAR
jgi:cellulose synthase operon protein C